ncbi:MAG: glycoside hydrolase family 38 C-terminal domain-containing protein, partial [Bacteroidota bacterium]
RSEEHTDDIETWNQELYLEKHRGTYTTHGWLKRENRLAERELYNAELLAVLGTLFGQKGAARRYPDRALEKSWKTLLLNHFHDILPGTAIEPAYEDVRADFQVIRTTCASVQETVLSDAIQKETKGQKEFHFSLFNPLASTRSEYVTLEVRSKEPAFMVCDKTGTPIDHQLLGRSGGLAHILCYVADIPPFSSKQVTVVPLNRKEGTLRPWKVTPKAVETSLFRVRLDSRGQFTSLYDKTLKRELLAKNKRGNEFQTFKDQPKQWDAWDLDPTYAAKATELLKCQSIKVIEEGPLRAILRVSHKSDRGSKVVQDIIFYHRLPRIDFRTSAIWKERQTLWKVAFPLNLRSPYATYEIQFGAVQRPTKASDPVHKAKFEVPAQQWADMSESKFGVSLLNDCKYGYDARENTLRLTLLRSPFYPHQVEPWRFNDDKVTDQGEHLFTYALWPHQADWRAGETVREARALNNPLIVVPGALTPWPSLFTLSHENIVLDSIKKAEEGDEIVIRLHEAHGQSTRATMEFGVRIEQALECDLLENEVGKLKLKKTKLPLKFSPFEIKTLRVRLRPRRQG